MQSPILNETTRLAVVANAKLGMLIVQGWEADGPATRIFRYGVPALILKRWTRVPFERRFRFMFNADART